MAKEICQLVSHPMQIQEFGLLDDLSAKRLNQLKTLSRIDLQDVQSGQSSFAENTEPFLMTQIRDKTPVLLSFDYASVLLTDLYADLFSQQSIW